MRRIRLGTAFALSFLVQTAYAEQPSLLPARVETAIRAGIDANQYSALTVVVVDGERAAVYPFGKLGNGKVPTAETVFEVGSVTKTFTATLLADQVQRGKLKLDAPVASLLPDFTVPSRNGKTITLENLGTQHSGLPRLPTNISLANGLRDPYAKYGPAQLKRFLAGYALPTDPGAAYGYSNAGFGLLGYALGRREGHGYDAALKSRVIDPLGMHDTVLVAEKVRAGMLADGHDPLGRPVPHWHYQVLGPTASVLSSARDMQRYLQANMGLLKTPLYAAMQLAQEPHAELPPNGHIGLAWMRTPVKEGEVVWHNGMTGGFASFIGFTADRKRGVVVLANRAEDVNNIGMAILSPSVPLAPVRPLVNLPAATLQEYVGRYALTPGATMNITRQGDRLFAQATGQDAFELSASAKDEFHVGYIKLRISFQRGADGKVSGLVLHDNGDLSAPRIADGEAEKGR